MPDDRQGRDWARGQLPSADLLATSGGLIVSSPCYVLALALARDHGGGNHDMVILPRSAGWPTTTK